MYCNFFNLAEEPFGMRFDPRFLYLAQEHRRNLAGLAYAIANRKSPLVLTGGIGAGKTTLLAAILQFFPKEGARFSFVSHPSLSPAEVLEIVLLNFGIEEIPASKAQCLHILENFVKANDQQGIVSAVVFDEAQDLTVEALQEIRLLGNIDPLIIILAGQNEVEEILNHPELESLRQRICLRLKVKSLSREEIEPYIRHRWKVAGGEQLPFSADALEGVAQWSRGVPRLINSLCDNALIAAFSEKSPSVELNHVDRAVERLDLRYLERQVEQNTRQLEPHVNGPGDLLEQAVFDFSQRARGRV
jgi:general secretion pathway protein A